MNKVSADWNQFGILLGIPLNILEGWEKQYQADSKRCWVKVMDHWLAGKANDYPVTWNGLYNLLEDAEYTEAAKELKEALAGSTV